MKKIFLSILTSFLILGTSLSYSQNLCSPGSYAVFADQGGTPKVLNVLGTSPQFGQIPKHTGVSAFNHLKSVYKSNTKKSKAELDAFFVAMGYSGFSDSKITANTFEPQVLTAGTTGWMGAYAKGHKYAWSQLGKDFEAYKILSADGSCHAYVMKKCGNVFFDPSTRCVPCTPCDPNYNNPEKCPDPLRFKPKTVCATQTINFNGKGKIMAGDVINTTQTFPVVASFGGKDICLGDYTVPVRLTYDVSATGEASYSKTVQVCDYGNGVPANSNINLPLDLKYMFEASDVSVGSDGRMVLALTNEKQFKTLSSVYKACPAGSNGTAAKTLVAKTVENTSTSAAIADASGTDCVKQTWSVTGSGSANDVSAKQNNAEVTMIGVYKKEGKLQKGETAEKNLCLGTYSVPAKSALQYDVKANSSMEHILEVCGTNGTTSSNEKVSVPVKLSQNVSKQEVMVGDYGRIYVPLTKSQYNKLKKSFKRCCSDGSTSGKCF